MLLNILLQPKASSNEIVGLQPDGKLKVKVTTVPVNNAANKDLIVLLAKKLKVAKSKIEIVKGLKNKEKLVKILCEENKIKGLLKC